MSQLQSVKSRFIYGIVLTIVSLALAIALYIVLSVLVSEGLAQALVFILGLIVMGIGIDKLGIPMIGIGIAVIAVGFLAGGFFKESHVWLTGKTIKNVSVMDVGNYSDATVFYFNDGMPQVDVFGEYIFVAGSQSSGANAGAASHYYVSPVVPENWQPGQPVSVWASCFALGNASIEDEFNKCREQWSKQHRKGLVLRDAGGGYAQAIENLQDDYDLPSSENRIIIEWTDNPEAIIANTRAEVFNVIKILFLVTLGYVLIAEGLVWFFAGRKK
jgi:hypothetical protein